MGNLIFGTTTVQGRTFDDIKIQTSKAGVPRPIVFGTARPIVGNIIATTAPRIVKVKEEQSGGKGGPSVEVENEEVYRTYAIRICEGPVTGITRVWRNNELVYERDAVNSTQIQNNNAFLERAEFFLGGFDQMPSSVMQAAFGISKVHGYRGTCYLVVDDENLTATGGAIPQYAFEVERCEGFVFSSRPFNTEASEEFSVGYKFTDQMRIERPLDAFSIAQYALSSVLIRNIQREYSGDEELGIGYSLSGIEIVTPTKYGFGDDSLTVGYSLALVNIEDVVVPYDFGAESFEVGYLLSSVDLVTP